MKSRLSFVLLCLTLLPLSTFALSDDDLKKCVQNDTELEQLLSTELTLSEHLSSYVSDLLQKKASNAKTCAEFATAVKPNLSMIIKATKVEELTAEESNACLTSDKEFMSLIQKTELLASKYFNQATGIDPKNPHERLKEHFLAGNCKQQIKIAIAIITPLYEILTNVDASVRELESSALSK